MLLIPKTRFIVLDPTLGYTVNIEKIIVKVVSIADFPNIWELDRKLSHLSPSYSPIFRKSAIDLISGFSISRMIMSVS